MTTLTKHYDELASSTDARTAIVSTLEQHIAQLDRIASKVVTPSVARDIDSIGFFKAPGAQVRSFMSAKVELGASHEKTQAAQLKDVLADERRDYELPALVAKITAGKTMLSDFVNYLMKSGISLDSDLSRAFTGDCDMTATPVIRCVA